MEIDQSNNDPTRGSDWPEPRDLTFESEKPLFQKYAGGRNVLVEIGVFEGASAACFRRAMSSDATLYLIDPFIPDSMNPKLVARTDFTYRNVESVPNGTVIWNRDYSYNVVKAWNQPIDFLFIDGDHQEQSCERDWKDWHRFVVVGGVVLFHDARRGKGGGTFWDGWDGPTKIVDRLFRSSAPLPGWIIKDEAGTVVVVERTA